MKYLLIVLGSIVASLAAVTAAVMTAFTVSPEGNGDGWLLLGPVQAKECRDGGGCMTWSEREFNKYVGTVQLQWFKMGRGTAPKSSCGASST